MNYSSIGAPADTGAQVQSTDLRSLFHELNNQLSVALAHAELLEAKATDPGTHARATTVVTAVLDAMALARTIRDRSAS